MILAYVVILGKSGILVQLYSSASVPFKNKNLSIMLKYWTKLTINHLLNFDN